MSDLVTLSGDSPVTTSLAIADGVGNSHKTVIQLIRQNTDDLKDFGPLAFEMRKSGGRPTETAILNEPQATLLLTYMRNNETVKRFKKALVKAFYEMRGKMTSQPDPMEALSDPATMRSLLLGYTEKVLALESENQELKPKAEALQRISEADGSLCITDAAKDLQKRPKDLFGWLSAHKWIFRRLGTSWIGYQDKVQSGYLEHKITTVQRQDGSEKATTQVRVTPKGLARLSQQFSIQEMH